MEASKHVWWFIGLKGLFLLAVGLFFIFNAETAVKAIALYLGLILLVAGLVTIFNNYNMSKKTTIKRAAYLTPTIVTIAGLILVFYPEYALTVFALSVGIWVLMDGFIQMKSSSEVSKVNKTLGNWHLLMGALSLIVGFVIIFNPLGLVELMTVLFGIILVLSSIFLFALALKLRE